MSEDLAFKGKWFDLVWIGSVWFGFFMLQRFRVVLVSIHTKFELSMCIVCPTIEINMLNAYLKNGLPGWWETL